MISASRTTRWSFPELELAQLASAPKTPTRDENADAAISRRDRFTYVLLIGIAIREVKNGRWFQMSHQSRRSIRGLLDRIDELEEHAPKKSVFKRAWSTISHPLSTLMYYRMRELIAVLRACVAEEDRRGDHIASLYEQAGDSASPTPPVSCDDADYVSLTAEQIRARAW